VLLMQKQPTETYKFLSLTEQTTKPQHLQWKSNAEDRIFSRLCCLQRQACWWCPLYYGCEQVSLDESMRVHCSICTVSHFQPYCILANLSWIHGCTYFTFIVRRNFVLLNLICITVGHRRLQGEFCQHHLGVSDLRRDHLGLSVGSVSHVFLSL